MNVRGVSSVAVLAAAFVCPAPALAEAGDAGDGDLLIPRGASFRYLAQRVPPPVKALGAVALAGLDAAGGHTGEVPSALGVLEAPEAFPVRVLESGRLGRAPFGARGKSRCRHCKTVLGDARVERVAALYATRRFQVEDPASLAVLEVAARYRDGIVIFVNGREIVRRNLPGDRSPVSVARRRRGGEWERFHIPVTPGLLEKGDNLLAVEVRPSGHRSAPTLDLELRGRREAQLVRGPIVQRPSPERAVIRFTTDRPVRGFVDWGAADDEVLGREARSAQGALAVQHRVVLEGERARSGFWYRVRAGSVHTSRQRVGPAPQSGEPIRFAVYGDMRGGHGVHGKLIEAIEKEAPDFVVVTGDLVQRGSDGGDWQTFFAVAARLLARIPYFPVAGNHDVGRSGTERRLMNELFELPPSPANRPYWGNWYSFDVADLHFVMLDSNSYQHRHQLDWLKQDLRAARARGVRAIFAATHDGPYSRGIHRGNRYAQAHYVPLLSKYGVDMLFAGHDHMYQRGEARGLRYIVSGGGGAPLYPVRCGLRGQKKCRVRDGMQKVARAYHYVMVTVGPKRVQVCAKRPDGAPLEGCVYFETSGSSR